MRRSFCGSHRERVEAAVELQSSRRRRRISLELEEFERPGGRALIEDSPEVEAYLAALSVSERPRRASLDCPRGAYGLFPGPNEGAPNLPLPEEEETPEDEQVDSKFGEIKTRTENHKAVREAVDRMDISAGVTKPLNIQAFNKGSNVNTRVTPKKMVSTARRMCSSLMKKISNSGSGSRSKHMGHLPDASNPLHRSSIVLTSPPSGPNCPISRPLPLDSPPVKINDTWASEGKLSEWVDWGVVDTALRPPDLRQAQAALISGSRGTGYLVAASAGSSKN